MAQLIDAFRLQTDFAGLLKLLAHSLYSTPEVFLRELLQNAHDAIVMRQELEPGSGGRIDVHYNTLANTLTVSDDGIGLDEQDIRRFLSVIAASNKATALADGRAQADLIGQFGIGLLSAFLVADSVTVITLKASAPCAYRWENDGSETCKLLRDERTHPGTDVTLHLRPEHAAFLDAARLQEVCRRYMDLLPFPIYVSNEGPVNAMNAPWHRSAWASQEEEEHAYREFLDERFPDVPLDVIPVQLGHPCRARGALFISDRHIPDISTAGLLDVYVKRTLIMSRAANILPGWAKFVSGIIDSPDLKPNAARDHVMRGEPEFTKLQAQLGRLVIDHLKRLAMHDFERFTRINQYHNYHLVGMALEHDDFFREVAPLLVFATNRGPMMLKEYLTTNATLPSPPHRVPIYFASSGAANSFSQLASANHITAIEGRGVFDDAFLAKFCRDGSRNAQIVRLDESDTVAIYGEIASAEKPKYSRLEVLLEHMLREEGNSSLVRVRRFEPATLASVVVVPPLNETEQALGRIQRLNELVPRAFTSVGRDTLQRSGGKPTIAILNALHPMVQRVADASLGEDVARPVLLGLYNSAFLGSRELLSDSNARRIQTHLLALIQKLTEQNSAFVSAAADMERERAETFALRAEKAREASKRPEHITLFMMTPYEEEYGLVEAAVRRVFESPPYFFQVMLARDYQMKDSLIENVREHMQVAHGFIADISDLNPNVMFELGAVLLPGDGRPVFCLRRADATKPVPADIRDRLRLEYASSRDAVEVTAESIRRCIERDGQAAHAGLEGLLNGRKKRYLSRTLLGALRFMRLQESDANALMSGYSSLEDFVATDPDAIAKRLNIPRHVVVALRGEFEQMMA